ncbi:hypothetical protein [Spongiactinospora sp. TRM90649]|uniref:hypothetical protein n=1 Tax=Spongiactinospora sp. TRM90649 TaxID=3031114 RepID=UPI0023F99F44|nr:hypothetical protein [Spongiactinospora sp. TRM90649]MDF5759414.1 hypothetical protein [Spongiactinospora sp. TRM90649]
MIQSQNVASTAAGARRMGIIGDGVFKVLLGAVFLVGAVQLGDLLGVPAWLMIASGAALLGGGGIEIMYVHRRTARTYMRLMVAYDSAWILVTLGGLLMTWRGGAAGGELWVGYQTAAPVVLAALLVTAAPAR